MTSSKKPSLADVARRARVAPSTVSLVLNGGSRVAEETRDTVLNGVSTYSGATTNFSGTLGGTGTLASAVTVLGGAILAPGASTNAAVGTLDVAQLTLREGAVIEWNFDASAQDLIRVSGTLTLPTSAVLKVSALGGAGEAALPDPAVLMTFGMRGGALALREWSVIGAPAGRVAQVDASNNRLLLAKIKGTMISIF
jgi:hypothetical protein